MLKWCFECVGGKLAGPTEAPYDSTHLNNSNRAPVWPRPRYSDETMFIVPRSLKSGDNINVTGTMNGEPKLLVASLVTGNGTPDFSNIACQVEAAFPEHITVKYTKDGEDRVVDGLHQQLNASNLIRENFNFKFILRDNSLIIKVDDMDLEDIPLQHSLDEIKFISLSGDYKNIKTLEFKFEN